MPLAPIARFAVPTGTAAATVVLTEPTGDADIDGRRFAALEALPDADFRGAFEELIVAGVYTVLNDRVLALRVNRGGVRSFAAAVAIPGKAAAPRAGLASAATCFGASPDSAAAAALRTLLESEARQRPVFHGTTPEGITYSGFEAQATAAILEAAAAIVPPGAPACHAALVFAGDTPDLPRGLVVGLLAAPV